MNVIQVNLKVMQLFVLSIALSADIRLKPRTVSMDGIMAILFLCVSVLAVVNR